MVPHIKSIAGIAPDQSVICIIGQDGVIPDLKLSVTETEYIKRSLADREGIITINSYYKLTILVREKKGLQGPALFEDLRRQAVKAVEELSFHKQSSVLVCGPHASEGSADALVEGLILASYKFSRFKTGQDKQDMRRYPESIAILNGTTKQINRHKTLAEAVFFARDRVNEPLSHLTAEGFSSMINDFCSGAGLSVTTLNRKQIEALKMGGLIAVNRGSNDPPTFSVIEWKPAKAQNSKPVILVGKGVVFDTGGLNLKPTNYIEDMKADMAGGAVVASVMYYIAKQKIPLNIIALVPATDNRPGQNAFAPGDVIEMYNGKSVEVLNTDAEGRLILADALSYAEKYMPSLVISIATLTGSASSTFGSKAIALMGNAGKDLMSLLEQAGELCHERTATLPFWDEYAEMLKSDIADLKNIGGKDAGAITAGKFLENFTGAPFIHLDIAGTAMMKEADYYRPKGGTGSGVRLLAVFFDMLADGNMDKLN